MITDDDLHQHETRRRYALRTLNHLEPGDPRAPAVLRVLDDLDHQERSFSLEGQPLSADQVLGIVPSERHPIGTFIVRDEAIPQPWRERFKCASLGSTRIEEGAYLCDWGEIYP
jgi:hypothetical protein